jgi:mannosylglucosylglycerate synthase
MNIGFVSTRFSGTDGVTLEAGKWSETLQKAGHECFWFSGLSDRDSQRSMVVPEAFFQHERIIWINNRIWGKKYRNPEVTQEIHHLRVLLKERIREFLATFSIDLIVAENALTIPMNLPLGLALTEIIVETQTPVIAHHHDFYWERIRYSVNAVGDFLRMAFPPNLHNIEHVVINTAAQVELAHRTGIVSTIIPNVLDFENPPEIDAERTRQLRTSIGLSSDDIMILQPTRVIARKGIEHAIDLVERLDDPRYKLVISHEAGDEGFEYAQWLKETAHQKGVDLRFLDMCLDAPLTIEENGIRLKSDALKLWDIYPHADFITYPSLYEGFGNAFLEAVYFKKPLLINRYAIFVKDIEPLGFDLIVMDGFLTGKNIREVREVLESSHRREQMVENNYTIASRHYSYAVLRKRLAHLTDFFFGTD